MVENLQLDVIGRCGNAFSFRIISVKSGSLLTKFQYLMDSISSSLKFYPIYFQVSFFAQNR